MQLINYEASQDKNACGLTSEVSLLIPVLCCYHITVNNRATAVLVCGRKEQNDLPYCAVNLMGRVSKRCYEDALEWPGTEALGGKEEG